MSFWDVVKKVAVMAKCTTGWHAGEYEHIEGKPKCFLGKKCTDCGKYVTTKKHSFSEYTYKHFDKCDQTRKCIHCKFVENEINHSYEEHGKDGDCKIIKICSRCGGKVIGKENHRWKNGSGDKKMCLDCNKIVEK